MAALMEDDPNKRDIVYLDQYAQERWDTVLHYLVGSSQQSGVSVDAVKILLHSGLMMADPNDANSNNITKSGFQFLLMETSSQVKSRSNSGLNQEQKVKTLFTKMAKSCSSLEEFFALIQPATMCSGRCSIECPFFEKFIEFIEI
jgi:hypothetical protein